jgi:hypothetical protein
LVIVTFVAIEQICSSPTYRFEHAASRVIKMASRSTPPCDHELRPGTTVCLRCQHAERAAKRARQRQMIARGAAATLVLGVIAAIGIAGATAIRARSGGKGNESRAPGDVPSPTPSPAAVDSAPSPAGAPPVDTTTRSAVANTSKATLSPTVPSAPTPPARASVGLVAPLVPVVRTALRDTMVADRAGDTVRVRFDLMLSRTRRPDKFEAIVRSTLPQVYGAPADSALRALPVGAMARAGDLLTTLAEQGFHIPLPGGRTIAVWPETREGRDGPLVVAYRAVASPR